MMADVTSRLREDYLKNEDRILTTFEAAETGVAPSSLFSIQLPGENEIEIRTDFETFSDKLKKDISDKNGVISREDYTFNDESEIGYSWVEKSSRQLAEDKKREFQNE